MGNIHPNIYIIRLNVYCLNFPIKKWRLLYWENKSKIKTKNQANENKTQTKRSNFIYKNTDRLKLKMEKLYHEHTTH